MLAGAAEQPAVLGNIEPSELSGEKAIYYTTVWVNSLFCSAAGCPLILTNGH